MRFKRMFGAIMHPITEWQVTSAKDKHRKEFPECALCDVMPTFFGRSNDVHHLIPVHINPGLACDPDNLITLCRVHHWLVGHCRDWKAYNSNVFGTILEIKRAYSNAAMRVNDEVSE